MSKKEKLEIEVEVPSKKIHVEHVFCPKGHQLCDPARKIHGYPAIKLRARHKEQDGIIYLDPIYGSFDHIEEGLDLKEGDLVDFFCPECRVSLKSPEETCKLCSSPMFILYLPKGGIIEGCTKKGCYFHRMKIVDAEEQISRLFENDTLESYL
ncbi:MAG: hypothetical protein EH225_02635 [Calditrichaeota bacterium]|nr:hypothetical protein [Calditrichota bacterium]RQW06961.1 MAG: hypothetical protein EH225_02635 [Calditrichota bacterium]